MGTMQLARRTYWLALLGCLAVTAAAADEGKKEESKPSRAAQENEKLRVELALKDKELASLRKQLDALKAELAATKKQGEKSGDRLWKQAQRDFDAEEYGKVMAALDDLLAHKTLDEARRRQANYLSYLTATLASATLARAVKSLEPGELRESLMKEQAALARRGHKRYAEGAGPPADLDARKRYRTWAEALAGKLEAGSYPALASDTWMLLGEYEKAIEGYEKLLTSTKAPAGRCDLLGRVATCRAAMSDVEGLKKTLDEVRKVVPKLDDDLRPTWERWLKETERALQGQPQKQDTSDR